MENEWRMMAQEMSDGWGYMIEVKQIGHDFYARVTPSNHPTREFGGAFESMEEAIRASKDLAQSYIKEIRALDGCQPD